MGKRKLNLTTENLINCAIYGVIGLLLIILRTHSLDIAMTVVGALFVGLGIIDIIKNNEQTKGIVEIVLGAIIIVCGWVITGIVLLVFGVLLVIKGGVELYNNLHNGIAPLLSPIATLLIGVLLVIAKWVVLDLFFIIIGAIFIVNAVLVLFEETK